MNLRSATTFAFVLLWSTADAHAAEEEYATEAERPSQLHVDGGLGGSSYGLHAGAIGLFATGNLRVGGSGYASGIFSSKSGGGVVAGVGSHGMQRLTLDVLAELGMNSHRVVRGGLLGDDPGATGAVPHAGVLLGARWYVGAATKRTRLTIGAWLSVRHDLDQKTSRYSYTSTGWFSGSESAATGSATIGGITEVSLRFAIGFDVTP